jgi:hypothetical protein
LHNSQKSLRHQYQVPTTASICQPLRMVTPSTWGQVNAGGHIFRKYPVRLLVGTKLFQLILSTWFTSVPSDKRRICVFK